MLALNPVEPKAWDAASPAPGNDIRKALSRVPSRLTSTVWPGLPNPSESSFPAAGALASGRSGGEMP